MALIAEQATIADVARIILTLSGAPRPARILITGPSHEAAIERLDAIQASLPTGCIARRSHLNGKEQIRLTDGTQIIARSRRGRGYARGYVIDAVIIDEDITADQYADVLPAMSTTTGRLLTVD